MRRWLAAGQGIVYNGDINKLKIAIFRIMENKRAYPMIVKTKELQLDDLIFTETVDRSGYCHLYDFHRDAEGNINYWLFSDSGISIKKQKQMMNLVKVLLDKEYSKSRQSDETLLISVRQNV